MKLTNYTTEIVHPSKPENWTFPTVATQLAAVLNAPPGEKDARLSMSEQRKRLRLLDVVENTEVDAEFDFSPEQVVQMREIWDKFDNWMWPDRGLVRISDELAAACTEGK